MIPPKPDGHGRNVITLNYGESVTVGDVVFTLAAREYQKGRNQGAKVLVTAPKSVAIDYPKRPKVEPAPEPVVIRCGGAQ